MTSPLAHSPRTAIAATVAAGIVVALAGPAFGQSVAAPPSDAALRAYIEQVEREWPGESAQQALTADSLKLLIDAIVSVAEHKQLSSPQVRLAVELLRRSTDDYRAGRPGTLEQSERLRQTLKRAADLVESLIDRAGLEKNSVDPRLSAIHRAAESLDEDMVLRRQPDVIERFFHHAGEALRRVDAAR